MIEKISVIAVAVAAILTAINQISIVITAKQLWRQQQQLQRQLEKLNAGILPKSETPNKMMDEVVTMERCFIDQDDHPVTVSFQLLCHDWKKIEKSDKWHQVEKKILKSQSKYNQMILRDRSGK